MNQRIPLDDMTSDQLDQLYAELDRLTAELADYDERAEQQKQRADRAADTVTRATGLYERWVKAGPPTLGASMARWWDGRLAELHDAINPAADTPTGDQP